MRQRIALASLLFLAAACTFKPDPDADTFTCKTDSDCGDAYKCVVQKDGSNRSLCYKQSDIKPEVCDGLDNDKDGLVDDNPASVGLPCDTGLKGECAHGTEVCDSGKLSCVGPAPVAESCNGLDDDCDGVTDNGFDLTKDPANCGKCGHACGPGSDCIAGKCIEVACDDGIDNDGNGLTDCADPACDKQSCGTGCECQSQKAVELTCDDGVDNDKNGKTDCADAACAGKPCAPFGKMCLALACTCPGAEPTRELRCSDGVDNDCDGRTDCDDPDCAGASCSASDPSKNCALPDATGRGACVVREASCGDGVDNDGDGLTDCADSDCVGLPCDSPDAGASEKNCGVVNGQPSCVARETSCGDRIDNDGDGKTDCADPDCLGRQCDSPDGGPSVMNCGSAGGQAVCMPRETSCNDGVDNDGDGKTDCADPDCLGRACDSPDGGASAMNCSLTGACVPRETDCGDGVDNDGDGKTDCADPDCEGQSCGDAGVCTGGLCQ